MSFFFCLDLAGRPTGGIIDLCQFNQSSTLLSFHCSSTTSRATRIQFNTFLSPQPGSHFVAALYDGNVNMWNFDANHQSLAPSNTFKTPYKHTQDVAFLESVVDVAAIGHSSDEK
jgi:hypothetical protein